MPSIPLFYTFDGQFFTIDGKLLGPSLNLCDFADYLSSINFPNNTQITLREGIMTYGVYLFRNNLVIRIS